MCLFSMSCCSGSKKRKTVKKITAKITKITVKSGHNIIYLPIVVITVMPK